MIARAKASFAVVWIASLVTGVAALALVALAVRTFGGDDTDRACIERNRAGAARVEASITASSTPEEKRSAAESLEGYEKLMRLC